MKKTYQSRLFNSYFYLITTRIKKEVQSFKKKKLKHLWIGYDLSYNEKEHLCIFFFLLQNEHTVE